MMTWRYGILTISLILSAIQRYIDPSKITLADINTTLIFVGMIIVSAIEHSRR